MRELLENARAVILDFDGPITKLLPPPLNRELAERAKHTLLEVAPERAEAISDMTDHLDVIRYAMNVSPKALSAVEAQCITDEVSAAERATPTDGVMDFLTWCHDTGRPVAIATNNSPESVAAFFRNHPAPQGNVPTFGRQPGRPDLMKPHPATLHTALEQMQIAPDQAIFIGDSATDAQAGDTASVPTILLAISKSKRQRLSELHENVCDSWVSLTSL